MRAWKHYPVPLIDGRGERPTLFDSRTRQPMVVGPEHGPARLYVCGITPYDATHLGHAFTYVSVDLLHRAWLDAGYQVRFAQNVTDVDDPLLERAAAVGVDWVALAEQETDLFRSDMEKLNVLPPHYYRGVVESLPLVEEAVVALRERGAAYQIDDPEYPDWYFDISLLPSALASMQSELGMDTAQLLAVFAERGGDPERPGKRHKLDSLLWRMERPGEPAWDSPLGRGRPGWHIECAALSLDGLGADFDVQAGGTDLAFPHHPMCAAQAQTLTQEPFAEAYMHVGMVGLDGEKMSKSKGNLVFVHKLLERAVPPQAIRLLLLAHHYRSEWEYTECEMRKAMQRFERWSAAFNRESGPAWEPVLAEVRASLANDLDAPSALAAIDAWAAAEGEDRKAPGKLRSAADALLGVRV
ncbi:MAG: cysteine--1-D-myo-inosityl 2-amino-2-deoxy-alpha-D-glucopyranoside ligase [Propionibacteriaceae bacterium]|jgi:L-cysteine:1D-myo-inositol 2-amino-2-deoxy-alpha-D-glucopyranoside ligase|nr:cysteine--1-D-myo-inosityl 2-amino-2-deoxy-alpha-D-glucopyranoside ligase [Propionibacteriaceae bacterium]